jgi:hypothetical protein
MPVLGRRTGFFFFWGGGTSTQTLLVEQKGIFSSQREDVTDSISVERRYRIAGGQLGSRVGLGHPDIQAPCPLQHMLHESTNARELAHTNTSSDNAWRIIWEQGTETRIYARSINEFNTSTIYQPYQDYLAILLQQQFIRRTVVASPADEEGGGKKRGGGRVTGKEKDSNLAVFNVGVNRYPTMVSKRCTWITQVNTDGVRAVHAISPVTRPRGWCRWEVSVQDW